MGAKSKKSLLAGIPAWGLALMTNMVSWIFLALLFDETGAKNSSNIFLFVVSFLLVLFFTGACYMICKRYPSSFWYVPLLCQFHIISSLFIEVPFWTRSPMVWMMLGVGILCSIIAAVIGFWVGRKLL
ncbi:hypothetical protein J1N10_13765 [Carboxylicivirga sp. A043]|uniref:hypothetical protein n=1 Tax=Carboxylicivirga litoralis TaxID=2816963 RepID=UPI0021CB25F0|nr:hypothetical protein [Carboxylicivirga sp. A043]MCU4157052.1 hypothetical protein [Carboxylicivirga sp. A043]